MDTTPTPETTYILGALPGEQARLMTRAGLEQRQLERCFEDAGLTAGMTVLDVGCGPGDVSMTAATLVGPTGRVIGVDVNPAMITLGRERTAAQGLANVTFLTSPLEELVLTPPHDCLYTCCSRPWQLRGLARVRGQPLVPSTWFLPSSASGSPPCAAATTVPNG
jgi:SAM-dependent methyltransferase